MAPIRRRHGKNRDKDAAPANNHENESQAASEHSCHAPPQNMTSTPAATSIQNLMQSVDDSLSHYVEEMYILTNIHAEEMKECAERFKTHFQRLENEQERRVQHVAAGEGSSQCPPTKVVTCWNCKTLSATMVWNPCGHMCFCFECDNKVSECPICKNKKVSSFMANRSSA